jgi:hypothetical protein
VIRILVEVRGTVRFRVAVRAKSIEQAVGIARTQYPGSEVGVLYPIDPEAFFGGSLAAEGGLVELEMPERVAG